jgi:hypothetical protein
VLTSRLRSLTWILVITLVNLHHYFSPEPSLDFMQLHQPHVADFSFPRAPHTLVHIHTQYTLSIICCRGHFFFIIILFGIIRTLIKCLISALSLAPVTCAAPRPPARLLISYDCTAICKNALNDFSAILKLLDWLRKSQLPKEDSIPYWLAVHLVCWLVSRVDTRTLLGGYHN